MPVRLGPQQLNISTIGSAGYFSRAILLVDVRGRLSRTENQECGDNCVALLSLREICGWFTRARTRRSAFQRSIRLRRRATARRASQCCDSRPLSRQVANQTGIHGPASRTIARPQSDFARYRMLRNGRRIRRTRWEIRALPSSRGRFTA